MVRPDDRDRRAKTVNADLLQAAARYHADVSAAAGAPIGTEPEAQLTTPVSELVRTVAEVEGLGGWQLLRETQLPGVRPDFGVLIDGRFAGWIELKAPGTGVDPAAWTGRNRAQWTRLAELDALMLCDGESLRLFRAGEPDSAVASLPHGSPEAWEPWQVVAVLRLFAEARPTPIRTASDLARRLAPLARDLRERIEAGLDERHAVEGLLSAHRIWQEMLREDITTREFADALAQVVAYGLVIATLDGAGDVDGDGIVSLEEAASTLEGSHRVLAATLRPLLDVEGLRDALRSEIGGLERMLGAVDPAAIARRKDPRGDAWLWFYEDFLGVYDPQARKQAGVYYTPVPVVGAITRLVESVLVERFGKPLGFGDSDVVTLDPAAGTGTFPLAVVDAAAARATAHRGPAGPQQVAPGLAARLFGFELLPGPFAVAHLRVGARLREMGATLDQGGAQLLLADTLDTPDDDDAKPQLELFGASKVLADEALQARRVKREKRVMAIVGNPPYRRLKADRAGAKAPAGGWVTNGTLGKPWPRGRRDQALLDDVVAASNAHTIFSHVASLYNLYVYFWRWAIWKAFEQHGDGPAVVGFITAASWLSGPGLFGLRELARQQADEIWICDLGGDNRGARPEESVFAIETPVAIVVLIRHGEACPQAPATVRYRRLGGSRAEKLNALDGIRPPDEDAGAWEELASAPGALFVPSTGGDAWTAMPALRDLLPWQQPGAMLNRTWTVSPDPETLRRRWTAFLDADRTGRSALFPDPGSGRTIAATVGGRPRLADLPAHAPAPPVARYAWRAYDAQWTFEDPRLAALERPALWQGRSDRQVYFLTDAGADIGSGPGLIPFVAVPDKHAFRGRGGKDVLPLYRDAQASQPNVATGLLAALGGALRADGPGAPDPSPGDLAAYLMAVLSTPAYHARFEAELGDRVVRVPLTADPALFARGVALGRRLLWLQTGATRMVDASDGRPPSLPAVAGLEWREAVTQIPTDPAAISYDPVREHLQIGDGIVAGVRSDVWDFSVSGWPVLRRWLEHRTRKGRGRRSSALDAIRPEHWLDAWNDELLDLLRTLTHSLDLRPEQDELLAAICDGPLIAADDLPQPTSEERAVPATQRHLEPFT
jgi:hypothetical protein